RVPASPVEPEQGQHYVVHEPLARKQREDLVGAGEPEMHAPLRRHARELLSEQPHRALVGGEVAGDEVEQRGLAGASRAGDQPAPFGPMTSGRSPGITESETSLVAGRPPKRFLRCATSRAGAMEEVIEPPPSLRSLASCGPCGGSASAATAACSRGPAHTA